MTNDNENRIAACDYDQYKVPKMTQICKARDARLSQADCTMPITTFLLNTILINWFECAKNCSAAPESIRNFCGSSGAIDGN